jgi:SAM-dependent methyltransferase
LKFLTLIFYFFRSVFLRGLLNTVSLIASEKKYEKLFGISTSTFKQSKSKEYFHYQAASYLVLFKIFKVLKELAPNYTFVDIGCGRGRVLFVAENEGYNELLGLDLDEELVYEAKKNSKTYKLKRKESSLRFLCVNAIEHKYEDRKTIYFMFNPFNESVLKKVLAGISAAGASESLIVYMNPLYKNAFSANRFQIVKKITTRLYTEAFIYRLV